MIQYGCRVIQYITLDKAELYLNRGFNYLWNSMVSYISELLEVKRLILFMTVFSKST